jgi:hypothetical protein
MMLLFGFLKSTRAEDHGTGRLAFSRKEGAGERQERAPIGVGLANFEKNREFS